MNELPDRPVVDLQATLGQLIDQASQGEVPPLATLEQPVAVLTNDLLGRQPPIGLAAMLPVSRNRQIQSIAVFDPYAKRSAACRRDKPSCSTACTTRSRRSIE